MWPGAVYKVGLGEEKDTPSVLQRFARAVNGWSPSSECMESILTTMQNRHGDLCSNSSI
jgi:hypothetical protein